MQRYYYFLFDANLFPARHTIPLHNSKKYCNFAAALRNRWREKCGSQMLRLAIKLLKANSHGLN